MPSDGIWPLLLPIAAVLLAVAWVGWRFFYATPPTRIAPSFEPAAPSPTPRCHTGGQPRRRPLLDRRLLRWSLLNLLVVGAIVGLTLPFASNQALRTPPPRVPPHSERIRLGLEGDRLVPPPPLPPSAFVTVEEPSLAFADRDWSRLDPGFARLVLSVLARMQRRGYPVALIEGYRSPERQNALAASARRLTKALAFESKHQSGLAADLAPVHDGQLVLSERDPWAWAAYQALGEESEAVGLTWGGRWSLQDYGHIEMKDAATGYARVTSPEKR